MFIRSHSVNCKSFAVMSIIKTEAAGPYLVDAIATGRPKLETLVDDETVVKTDPESVYYNGPCLKDVAPVNEECALNDDPVCFCIPTIDV